MRPVEAVTVSGASSELDASSSASVCSICIVDIEGSSILLLDEGVRSSDLNLLWVALGGLREGSTTGVSSIGPDTSAFILRFLAVLPFLDGSSVAMDVAASELGTSVVIIEVSRDTRGRLVEPILSDSGGTGSEVLSMRASFRLGASRAGWGDEGLAACSVASTTESFPLLLVGGLLGGVSRLSSAFLFLFEAGVDPLVEGPCTPLLGRAWSWLLVETIVFSMASASSACSCYCSSALKDEFEI